jgi:hypothetical protein
VAVITGVQIVLAYSKKEWTDRLEGFPYTAYHINTHTSAGVASTATPRTSSEDEINFTAIGFHRLLHRLQESLAKYQTKIYPLFLCGLWHVLEMDTSAGILLSSLSGCWTGRIVAGFFLKKSN